MYRNLRTLRVNYVFTCLRCKTLYFTRKPQTLNHTIIDVDVHEMCGWCAAPGILTSGLLVATLFICLSRIFSFSVPSPRDIEFHACIRA